MRIGILEIIVIIAIIIAIIFVTRIYRGNPAATEQSNKSSSQNTYWQAKEKAVRKHNYLKRAGIIFFVAGIILALTGMSMFRWAVQSYVWSFIIVGVGFALLFLSKKK